MADEWQSDLFSAGQIGRGRSYVGIMLKGARELGLDSEYIGRIEEFYRQGQ